MPATPRKPLPTSVDVGYALAFLIPVVAVFFGVYAMGRGHTRHGLGIVAVSAAMLAGYLLLLT